MTRKIIVIMAMMILAVCLLSGGCSRVDDSKIDSWKDMLKIPTADKNNAGLQDYQSPVNEAQITGEQVVVKLYFIDTATNDLAVEERTISKVEGIARLTMEELIKGPFQQEMQPVIPATTTLLDINIKPDGLCIIDLSSEVNDISSREEGELMVQAIAKTLGQFSSIGEISFLIDGEMADTIGGLIDIAAPVQAIYSK